MVTNSVVRSLSQPLLPLFNGDCYEHWSIKMSTLFKSQDLWDLVESGYSNHDDDARKKENCKQDSKALFFIQQAVHKMIFPRIAVTTTSKQAWITFQTEFQGLSKVIAVKLQTLRQELETL